LWKTGLKKPPGETQDAVPGAILNLSEVAPGECYPRALLLEVAQDIQGQRQC